MRDPTQRFSDRVEQYVKCRPSYPDEVISTLQQACGLSAGAVVADIGAGTGIFTRLLLQSGARVIGVEPNDGMRAAADHELGDLPKYVSCSGSAEETGLDDSSVDLITAAQSFHWFRQQEARDEFVRVLRPGGYVALIWNARRTDTPFLRKYEQLLIDFSPDYEAVNHLNDSERKIRDFFSPQTPAIATFPNQQQFTCESLEGRLQSSSYAPRAGQRGHGELLRGLRRIFDDHALDGLVNFDYHTEIHYGILMA